MPDLIESQPVSVLFDSNTLECQSIVSQTIHNQSRTEERPTSMLFDGKCDSKDEQHRIVQDTVTPLRDILCRIARTCHRCMSETGF